MKKISLRDVVLYCLIIFVLVSVLWTLQNMKNGPEPSYADIRVLLEQQKVSKVTVDAHNNLVLTLREPVNGSETVRYELYSFQLFYDDFNDLVQQQYAEGIIQHYDYPEPVRTNWLLELLPFLLTAVILGLMWYFLVIRPQGGGMGPDKMAKFGSARTRMLTDKDKKVTFDDVAGADEEKEELREIVEFLKDPKKYLSLGARIPKGVLLFLWGDTAEPDADGLREMMMYAQRPDVCAVMPLVADARNRVLHAGYDILPDGTVRSRNRGLPVSAGGWHGMNRTSYNVTAVSPMCFLVRRNAFVPMAEGNSLAVDLAQWCMARMQDGMRHVYTPHCVVKADAESAFEGFRVKVPAGWYDPCATGSKRA